VTSIDTSKTVTQLTETEVAQFCKDIAAYGTSVLADPSFRRYSCGATAAVAAQIKNASTDDALRAECRAQLETCLAKPATSDRDGGSDGEEDDSSKCPAEVKASTCSAKLSEYTQCLYEQYEAYRSVAASTDFCATLKIDGMTPKQPEVPPPASCSALAAKCPELDL